MFHISAAKKTAGRFCCAYNCTSEPVYRKGGLCHKHYARKRRETDPIGTRYSQFKNNAGTRHKDFSITIEQFRQFCIDTGYLIVKGRRGKNSTIDRIKNEFGYHIWNIQLLTIRQNSSKGCSDDCPF